MFPIDGVYVCVCVCASWCTIYVCQCVRECTRSALYFQRLYSVKGWLSSLRSWIQACSPASVNGCLCRSCESFALSNCGTTNCVRNAKCTHRCLCVLLPTNHYAIATFDSFLCHCMLSEWIWICFMAHYGTVRMRFQIWEEGLYTVPTWQIPVYPQYHTLPPPKHHSKNLYKLQNHAKCFS